MRERELTIRVRKLVKNNKFEVIFGEEFLDNKIKYKMIDRPSAELLGNLEYADEGRVLIIGAKEAKILSSFKAKEREEKAESLLKLNPPCIIFSGMPGVDDALKAFLKVADKYQVPLVKSDLKTTPLISLLYDYLHEHLSEPHCEHGVLIDIFGMGTLVIGDSGVGKSETALELIKRGHILVADDLVEIKEQTVGTLMGEAPQILRRYLEIRGIGIVDVVSMFGAGAYEPKKRIQLVVVLEKWDNKKAYDRLGLETDFCQYFNTIVPKITIPIQLGRSSASLVESAALNQKIKELGYNAAYVFTESVSKKARGELTDEDDE